MRVRRPTGPWVGIPVDRAVAGEATTGRSGSRCAAPRADGPARTGGRSSGHARVRLVPKRLRTQLRQDAGELLPGGGADEPTLFDMVAAVRQLDHDSHGVAHAVAPRSLRGGLWAAT